MDTRFASVLLAVLLATPACAGAQETVSPAPQTAALQTDAPAAEAGLSAGITQEEMTAAGLGERILWRGMEGEDVKIVQRRLKQLGYYLGEIDGVFGLGTRRAVYGFQRAHKLEKIDGKVGPATIARMFAEDVIAKPTPEPTATPTPTATPVPTPTPTPVPDAAGAPFALAEREVYVDDEPVTLFVGEAEDGELLYPLCGVMERMGYEYAYESGSWTLTNGEREMALMTDGQDGPAAGAMGSADGVVFLADETSRVYVYGGEAYLSAGMLKRFGVDSLLVGGTPVIHP